MFLQFERVSVISHEDNPAAQPSWEGRGGMLDQHTTWVGSARAVWLSSFGMFLFLTIDCLPGPWTDCTYHLDLQPKINQMVAGQLLLPKCSCTRVEGLSLGAAPVPSLASL